MTPISVPHISPIAADDDGLRAAAAALHGGKLVIFPTETVYGIGADAGNDDAIAHIFTIKKRPKGNPLIVHCRDLAHAERIADFDDCADNIARFLAHAFWPGPLTLVMKRGSHIAKGVCAGLDTVALRVPANPIARRLLDYCDCPIAAPSANISGQISPTRAKDVVFPDDPNLFGVLDGGSCANGIESTIIAVSPQSASGRNDRACVAILRPGPIDRGAIARILSDRGVNADIHAPTLYRDGAPDCAPPDDHSAKDCPPNDYFSNDYPNAPGQYRRHYAPSRPVRLDVRHFEADEAALLFAADPPPHCPATAQLSRRGDLDEAAANLYHMMRRLDRPSVRQIAVSPIPHIGIGIAINDRLQRAAGG